MSRNQKTMRTARKPYVCAGCRCAISPGDTYRDSNPPPLDRPDGLPLSGRVRLCVECAEKHASLADLVDSRGPQRGPDFMRMLDRKLALMEAQDVGQFASGDDVGEWYDEEMEGSWSDEW